MVDRPPQAQCHGLRDGLTPKMGPNPADLIAVDPLDAVQAPSQLTVSSTSHSVIVNYLNVDQTRTVHRKQIRYWSLIQILMPC
jgi:hypothetical protein